MSIAKRKTSEIHNFILSNIEKNPKNITTITANHFNLSRNAVLRHIHQLVNSKYISAKGVTKNRSYSLAPVKSKKIKIPLTPDLTEDGIWRDHVSPLFSELPGNVKSICQYGFTEMVNNVLDHSEATKLFVEFSQSFTKLTISIIDDGIGIFHKIKTAYNLDNELHAILELSKGKLTTNPENHSGEGIFFSSRLFDFFSIVSSEILLMHFADGDDWATEIKSPEQKKIPGTGIEMQLSVSSNRNLQDVFDEFASEEDYSFSRTVVPVFLAQYGDENLISRSQAKRLLARFEKFKKVILDFRNVDMIGQAFADEIFRVFVNKTPNTQISYVNANKQIIKMINRAQHKE
jgi:anti-sigma regulatory factor (Ser/Thr protein kinase)